MFGKLEKLKILGFLDEDFLGIPFSIFIADINPESYQISKNILYTEEIVKKANEASTKKLVDSGSKRLNFTMYLDSTGVLGVIPVPVLVAQFMATTALIIPDIHRPPFVIINWGTLIFKGVMDNVDINYTLFDSSGIPLRATVNASFVQHVTPGVGALLASLQSPDLTKEVIVKSGDTLPLLCYQIYKDASMYIKVAEANNLKNFRKLDVGQKLIFPPIVNNVATQ